MPKLFSVANTKINSPRNHWLRSRFLRLRQRRLAGYFSRERWRLEGFPAGQEPFSHLFKNNRDGTFTDVTAKAV